MYCLRMLLLLSINLFFSHTSIADIPASNVGEQAMIGSLRSAIYLNTDLRSKNIVLGAGMTGCQAFQKSAPQGALHVLITSQYLETMKNLATGTVVVMPEHAVNDNVNAMRDRIHLITIQGVLHSRTLERINNEDAALIDNSTRLVVMLAGDTEQQNGTWQPYTTEMVAELLNSLPKDRPVLLLSGPRTGRHKIVRGNLVLDETAHRSGIDEITRYVMQTAVNRPWKVVDFKFGTDSLWGAVLKFCLNNPHVVLILPGESTSMISEALSSGIRPAIYQHPAMTVLSEKYVDELVKQHKATPYPLLPRAEETKQLPVEPQEKKVVDTLVQLLSKKPDVKK